MSVPDLDILFYELIRVAIGVQNDLSRTLTSREWEGLYKMAQKQSLVGVCFAGVQRLCNSEVEYYAGMSELQYLTWMSMAAQIQQNNAVLNQKCAELQRRLSADGFNSCVLKGQGVAKAYNEQLRDIRQSGDIDVWICENREKILAYVQRISPTNKVTRLHTQLKVFVDTEVEIHVMPTYMRCPWVNRRLQKWFRKYEQFDKFVVEDGIRIPSAEFNLVFLLLHIYRHFLGEGVGLRQIMDYYFILILPQGISEKFERNSETLKVLRDLHLCDFAAGLMWVMQEVFCLPRENMLCEPDEKLGRLILREIEISGNFGQYDNRAQKGESVWKRFCRTNASNFRFIRYFPEEVLCTPFYRIWHKCWQMKYGYRG